MVGCAFKEARATARIDLCSSPFDFAVEHGNMIE